MKLRYYASSDPIKFALTAIASVALMRNLKARKESGNLSEKEAFYMGTAANLLVYVGALHFLAPTLTTAFPNNSAYAKCFATIAASTASTSIMIANKTSDIKDVGKELCIGTLRDAIKFGLPAYCNDTVASQALAGFLSTIVHFNLAKQIGLKAGFPEKQDVIFSTAVRAAIYLPLSEGMVCLTRPNYPIEVLERLACIAFTGRVLKPHVDTCATALYNFIMNCTQNVGKCH